MNEEQIKKLVNSRREDYSVIRSEIKETEMAEGGCGVIGVASSVPIKGKFFLDPLIQMHNRGNGKGGGIAAAGLSHDELGVSKEVLDTHHILQIAYLDSESRAEVEEEFISPHFEIAHSSGLEAIDDHKTAGLDVKPPLVWRYFVRAKKDALVKFIKEKDLSELCPSAAEDEFIYQNSFLLNKKYYASLGDKKAFVVSHAKDMIVLKIVGYAEQVITYYKLEDLTAHVWIGHQRYPTKGKVWHPGGSHPFIGLNDALVHNGDFANYHSISEYLEQKNMYPLFLTDTEVAVLYWDLLTRTYEYPLEYAIEAIAPTTERDFTMLPAEKQDVYKKIQTTHINGSPDGPWFFIIARVNTKDKNIQLIGITDTSMLRPQVFSLQKIGSGPETIGIISSEKQATDSLLTGLSKEDARFSPRADTYWYARGGSYTDGGAFIFTIDSKSKELICTDKFGNVITAPGAGDKKTQISEKSDYKKPIEFENPKSLFSYVSEDIKNWNTGAVGFFADELKELSDAAFSIEALTLLMDRRYDTGAKVNNRVSSIFERALFDIFDSIKEADENYTLITRKDREKLNAPKTEGQTLVINLSSFDQEGDDGACALLETAVNLGWRHFIAYDFCGHRNFAAGLICPKGEAIRIDAYGRVGDCFAAFSDGAELHIHESAQDSVAYCFKSGKLVIYGDAGKAFEYGAKGGVAFILGDLIDRPLINAVGSATAVINGSCKDYMGESCMAADGFTILNGMSFDSSGKVIPQKTPYQGGNLFPLAAASTVYLRDPQKKISSDQLNGGKILPITKEDWEKILPLLEENESLFGIRINEDLLTVNGEKKNPIKVYRKVVPEKISALMKYEEDSA